MALFVVMKFRTRASLKDFWGGGGGGGGGIINWHFTKPFQIIDQGESAPPHYIELHLLRFIVIIESKCETPDHNN